MLLSQSKQKKEAHSEELPPSRLPQRLYPQSIRMCREYTHGHTEFAMSDIETPKIEVVVR